MARTFFSKIFKDIGIDLGTANTVVYCNGRGFILNAPSVIALNAGQQVLALGVEAKRMMGKVPASVKVIRPLADGVIADFTAAEEMVKGFIRNARVPRILINKLVVGVPTGITAVERRAVLDSAISAGARRAYLVSEPMAAAIGVGLDVLGGEASMIVDIGGGTTDIAVINYGGIVLDNTLRIAGDEMNEAVIRYFKNQFHLRIGLQSAEKLKMLYGNAHPSWAGTKFEVQGLDAHTNLPRRITVDSGIFPEALATELKTVSNAIMNTLEQLPPDLAEDLIDRGIILTGGGALLRGLDDHLREQIEIPVSVPPDALLCVARGTEKILSEFKRFQPILSSRT